MEEGLEESVAGGAWLFLSSLAVSGAGFLFWLVIAGVAGVSSVGAASAVVSGAAIASTLASSGLGLAVAREAAVRGPRAVAAGLLLAGVLAVPAGVAAAALAGGVGYASYRLVAAVLAASTILSMAAGMGLVGLERFRGYFLAALAGAASKLAVGVSLALLGYSALAALLGYTAYPLAAAAVALALLAPSLGLRRPGPGGLLGEAREIAVLAASNYPFMLSTQLLTTLGVYVFAYIARAEVETGRLYIALMVSLVLASIPGSLLGAALPVGARRGSDPYASAFRLGLALATPPTALVLAAPRWLLGLVNPGLEPAEWALRLTALSVAPAAAVAAAVVRLNKEARRGPLALLGAARLGLLLALLPPLARLHGLEGAAAAYLASSALVLPLALHHLPGASRPLAILWAAQLIGLPLGLAGQPQPLAGLEALLASAALLPATGALTPGEARWLAGLVAKSLKPKANPGGRRSR